MATQTLEFSAGTGLTLSCKLFALGSDTVVATASAAEKTNDKNRYTVQFSNLSGAYRLNAFVGVTGGFANEVYDVTDIAATFTPRSEAKIDTSLLTLEATSQAIKAKTDLITAGQVQIVSPVGAGGNITTPIFAGDDYKASNGRAFEWTIDARTGFSASTATCRFGGSSEETGDSWNVTGTVTDIGGGEWKLSFDLTKAVTATLSPGFYRWSVELKNPSDDEVTEVYNSNANRQAEVRAKQT